MPDRNVFLPLPADLYEDAVELARLRHVTVTDLLVEALSNSIEQQQRNGWVHPSTALKGFFGPAKAS